jgi:uncharacterized protein YjiS (DUF1127 family)
MTYTTHAARASLWERLSELRVSVAEHRAQHRAYRSTLAQLSAMSNRDLTDIGIHPADIDRIAREAAYGV